MLKWKILVLVSLISFMASLPCFAADVAKIGIVDIQKVLHTSSIGKMAKAQINKKAREMEANLNEKKDEIQKLKESLEREALVISKEKQEEREREIRIKINDIRELKKKYENDLKQIEAKVVKRIQVDVSKVVQEIGKKEGYLMVISNAVVLYSPTSIDITDQLIEAYNAYFATQEEQFDVDKLD
ncbi:MAG: OmpH family outer membrane protein [Deltaproteobacteria bacterium]|jgi:outer membrane protein